MEPVIKKSEPVDDFAQEALIDAIGLIDFAHRCAQLLDALPLINKKQAPMRLLRNCMTKVEQARNHLQHMRGDLSTERIDYPILGSIAWANEPEAFMASFTQTLPASQFGLVFDNVEKKYVNALEFSVKEFNVDLDLVRRRLHEARDWVVSIVAVTPPEALEYKWGKNVAACFRWMPLNDSPS